MRLVTIIIPLLLTACVGPQATLRNYKVADGAVVALPVSPGGPLPSQTKDIKIEVTGFMTDGQKAELSYAFGFTEKHNSKPRKVLVEDVSGSHPVTLVIDDNPVLDEAGFWKGTSSPKKAGDPSLNWLLAAGNTEKVFKFTIILGDGRREEIYQASVWSG